MSTDVFVLKFAHLKNLPREKEALQLLQRLASLVKPIMRKHGWCLPVLAEFFPENLGLLGLNINGGQKICIRLRPAFDKSAFLQEHELIGTMLHELTHNVRGPHDQQFYAFLSKLEDEFDALQRSGYAGEGFFSAGKRLGQGVSHDLPPRLAREKALAAAERRARASGVMLGGKSVGGRSQAGKTRQQLAAEAAERRIADERSCASGQEAQTESDRAARDGVEDFAEEDSDPEIIILDGPPSDLTVRKSDRSSLRRPATASTAGASSSRSSEEIPCPSCTFHNPATAKQCELCETALRPSPPKRVPTKAAPPPKPQPAKPRV